MHIILKPMMRGKAYSAQLIQQAKEASFIHKLTYKFPKEMLADEKKIVAKLSDTNFTI